MHAIKNETKYTVHYVGGVPTNNDKDLTRCYNYAVVTYRGVQRLTFLPSNIESIGETLVELVDTVLESSEGLPVTKEGLSWAVDILIADREAQGRTFYAGRHLPKKP